MEKVLGNIPFGLNPAGLVMEFVHVGLALNGTCRQLMLRGGGCCRSGTYTHNGENKKRVCMVDEYIIHHDVPCLVHITISVKQDSMKCMVMVHMERRCIHGMWEIMIIK